MYFYKNFNPSPVGKYLAEPSIKPVPLDIVSDLSVNQSWQLLRKYFGTVRARKIRENFLSSGLACIQRNFLTLFAPGKFPQFLRDRDIMKKTEKFVGFFSLASESVNSW